jgi:hypothetical protein
MFPTTIALSLIEQLELSGERAWIGDAAPQGIAFGECDILRLPGFRPSTEHFGRYDSVWLVQDVLARQGWRILLDSCVRMLAPHGTLVVRYLQNQFLSIPALKGFLFRKYGLRVTVRAEIIQNGEFITAFQVERDVVVPLSQKIWTFGILTQGKKVDLVERFCRSVREYGGPDHEIIIIGPHHSVYDPYNPVYIDKQYSTAFSDICVKKNDLVARASHENICVLHDRYILNQDFFSGFDTYGYDFDFLTIRQHHASGKIYPSYCAMNDGGHLIWGPIYECGNENESWDRHYLNGGLIIAKRALLRAVPFNALIFHNQAEDVELAKALESLSVLPRINRLSSAVTDVPDHLTDAFAYAEHPWESPQVPGVEVVVQGPVAAPQPLLVADVNGVPWRRVKGVGRRVKNVGRRVRNLRRDGSSWLGVATSAARFMQRRVVRKMQGAEAALSAAPAIPARQRPDDREGCNILLYSGDTGGVLNLTVHYIRRLQREKILFCIVAFDREANISALPPDLDALVVDAPVYPRNLWCIGFPFVSHHLNIHSKWAANRWNVNFTHWELPYVPQRLAGNFALLDGVMTTTEFVREAIAGVTNVPIEIVDPEVRIEPAVVARFDRGYFGLPENKRLFLLNWEFTSSTFRKNPVAGVRAFEEAFSGTGEQVALVMHVKIAPDKDVTAQAEYSSFVEQIRTEHPHVIIVEQQHFTYDEALGLKNVCDCYVSLHRSEGYGMGCAEALALGRYCIMTGWSGNMELLKNPEWAARIATVDVALVPVLPEDFPWIDERDEVFQLWADVRPGDAVQKMRAVYAAMIENKDAGGYVV